MAGGLAAAEAIARSADLLEVASLQRRHADIKGG
jgi:hypothetical protein